MTKNEIKDLLKKLSEEIVFLEIDDLQALASMHTDFENLVEWSKENYGEQNPLYQAYVYSEELIEKIIMNECEQTQIGMDILGKIIEIGQLVEVEGFGIEEMIFPDELGLSNLTEESVSSEKEVSEENEVSGNDRSISESKNAISEKNPQIPNFKLPANVDERIFTEFLTRQPQVLEEMEEYILSIEKNNDPESVQSLKRMIHTLKGEAGLLGLSDIQRVCHDLEDQMNMYTSDMMIDLLLDLHDWLQNTFNYYTGKGERALDIDEILEKIANFDSVSVVVDTLDCSDIDSMLDEILIDTSGIVDDTIKKDVPTASTREDINFLSQNELNIVLDTENINVNSDSDLGKIKLSDEDIKTIEELEDQQIEIDEQLIAEFINESFEHMENCDVNLLTLETEPKNNEALNAVFRAFHTIKGAAGFLGLSDIGKLTHEGENLLDKARKGELELSGPVIDVVFEAVDICKSMIGKVKDNLESQTDFESDDSWMTIVPEIKSILSGEYKKEEDVEPDHSGKKVGEILVDTGFVTNEEVGKALDKQISTGNQQKIGEILVKESKVPAKEVAKAIRKQQKPTSVQHHKNVTVKETVKVDAERLDRLVDTIGELVIAESMVSQASEIRKNTSATLLRNLSLLDKMTRELQEMAMSLRMVPVSGTFHKMARLVRDLSKKINKPVNFITNGEDTELDKSVVDKIGDPLIHMVRNAVDHGIEDSQEDRIKLGKKPTGSVELRAFHKGGNIYIEIEDDGRGLDKERIRSKAVERGLITENDTLSDKEIFNLIFEPGFSTAQQITAVSGRGVGMDVVKKNIEALRGRVEISSKPGKGSVFSIRLPLTLAIIDGMIIRVGHHKYILPTLSIIRSLKPEPKDLTKVLEKGEMLTNQGRLVPIFHLGTLFDVESSKDDPTESIIIIIENDGAQTGIVVDEIVNQQQIVIKSLGSSFKGLVGISGGTIMHDGKVGLILDVAGLVKLANGNSYQLEAA